MEAENSLLRCRICWEEKIKDALVLMSTLWATGSKKTIKEIILFCVPSMSLQDSNYICKNCVWHLNSTYSFIRRCFKTEKILVRQTADVIHELNVNNSDSGKLENILGKSIEEGKDIQIIFVNPVGSTEENAKKDEVKLQDHTYFIRSKPKICKNVKILCKQKENLDQTQPDITVQDDSNSNHSNNDTGTYDICDNSTLSDKDEKLEGEKKPNESISEEYHPNDTFPKELLDMLDFVPENVRCISIENDMSPDHQKGLIQEGVNILNMSTDASKKKRVIYLTREFESCLRQCTKCQMLFYSRNDFIDHKHMHRKEDFLKTVAARNERKFTCDLCSAKFTFDGEFRKHYKTAHAISCPHKCAKCLRRFRSYSDLKDHQEVFKDSDKCFVKCNKCDKKFVTKRQLEIHEADVADAPCCNYFKCKVCLVKFSREDFKTHCELHPNYICPECGKSLLSAASLSAHRNNVHKATGGMCHECGKVLKGASMLRHHIDTIHGGNIYMCDRCPRQFKSNVYLRKHMFKVHVAIKQKNFTCETCGKAFTEKSGLNQHIELLHERSAKFVCPTCGEGFVRSDYLQRHIKRHDLYMQYSCTVCKTSFSSESRLMSHQAIGHDENGKPLDYRRTGNGIRRTNNKTKKYASTIPRVCKICHKVLANSKALRMHYKAHLKIREFWCEKCQLTLRTYSTYKNHLKRHENPNFEWSCNICHAYKSSRAELEIHMRQVHKNKKYNCKYCPLKFGRKHLLHDHETIKHPEVYAKKENLFKILDAQKDDTAPEGSRVSRPIKGVKIGVLETDIDQMVNKLLKSKTVTLDEGGMDGTQTLIADEKFDILNEDYQMTEEEVACSMLQHHMEQDF